MSRNKIDVLLIDGEHDHYVIRVPMGAHRVRFADDVYVRTDEVRKVDVKHVGTETYRVYEKERVE